MILDKNVFIKINSKNMRYYINLGYNISKKGVEIKIDIKDLSKGSHKPINVKCHVCNVVKKLKYFKYNKNIERGGYYSCSQKCGSNKRKETNLKKYGSTSYIGSKMGKEIITNTIIEKYGSDNLFKSEEIKKRIKLTNLKKYGVDHPMKNKKISKKSLKTRMDMNIIFNVKSKEYDIYKNKVRSITYKNKKNLYNKWDGLDYYDNENISEYFTDHHNSPNYPTIDHKTPVSYGFVNNIPAIDIGHINNLCITKRKINSSKNNKIESIYVQGNN